MDADQFNVFMERQSGVFREMVDALRQMSATQQISRPQQEKAAIPVPLPPPLELEGDMEQNFEFFVQNWKNYASAVGMDKWSAEQSRQKTSVLLSVIGNSALKKYFNFELTNDQQKNPDVAIEAIKQKVVRERNKMVDWYDYFSMVQDVSESIDEYVARLKSLAKLCHFEGLEENMVMYKVVTSSKWPKLRAKLLTTQNLTSAKAIDMCRTEEIAEKHAAVAGHSSGDVNMVKSKKKLKCKYCGDWHDFEKGSCPALGKKCHGCGGRNHFERVCKADSKKKRKNKQRKVKKVQNDGSSDTSQSEESENSETESEEEAVIGKVYDFSDAGGNVLADLEVFVGDNWQSVRCELDTGANTSLVGVDWLKKTAGGRSPELLPSKYRLQSFGGGSIPVLGEVHIPCRRSGRKYTLALQVVNVNHMPLLSAKVCKKLGFVKFCHSVVLQQPKSEQELLNVYRVKAEQIVNQHKQLFEGYGQFSGIVSLEVDPNVVPSIQQPRRVPIAMRGLLKDELTKLERDGIIVKETQHTDWVSNIVLVRRGGQTGSVRICLDPIPLNKALKRPRLQFTTIDEVLPELGRAKVFSTVDAKKGFWHVLLDEESSRLTTFWTPFGRYRWVRMPFGIAPAPEIFQVKLQEVIQGLKGVECLADDVLIYGSGETFREALEDHNRNLKKLFQQLERKNVKLNLSKLKLCETSVKFFGHILTNHGLKADESKIATIKEFPAPTDRKQLQRFIGMVNYLGRYIKNLSAESTMLRRLISEKEPWSWTNKEEEEFKRMKAIVGDVGTLQYYDVSKPLVIECDASSFGLGAMVLQEKGVIGYASRTLTATEKCYAQIEKELLAILFACIRFDQLIVGNPKTIVRTDHKPLLAIFRKPLLSTPRRLQHMLLSLQRYNLELQFVTGKDNVVADAISRAPLNEKHSKDRFEKRNIYRVFNDVESLNMSSYLSITDERLNEVIVETRSDPTMQMIIEYITKGWPYSIDKVPDAAKVYFKYRAELSTQDGIVFRSDRIVVPHTLRKKLTKKVHLSHNGIEATLKLARANLFWPGMSGQIKEAVMQCGICAKFGPSQPSPPMKSHAIPVHPFQVVSMDVFFAEYLGDKKKFLVTVDHFSDFFEVDMLHDLTPKCTIKVCKANFSRHGRPQLVVTDNGTNFVNKDWKQFALDWDFQHTTSAPHHQQANGKAEAAVKIAKRLLQKSKESGVDFWYALLHWRNVPNKIGTSPVVRMFSRSTRCGIPMSAENLIPKAQTAVPEAIENNRRKAKYHYDKRARNLPALEKGDPVYVQLQPATSKQWTPANVCSRLSERSYVVDVDGACYRRDLVNLKPRNEPSTPTQPSMSSAPGQLLEMIVDKQTDSTRSILVNDSPNNQASTKQTPRQDEIASSNESNKETPKRQTHQPVASMSRPKRTVKLPSRYLDYEMN